MANFKYTTNTQNNVKLFWGLWSRRGGGGQGFLLPGPLKASPQRAYSHAMLRHAIVVQVRLDSSQMAPTLTAWVETIANRSSGRAKNFRTRNKAL